MGKTWKRESAQITPGRAPGSFNIDPSALPTRIQVIAYGPDRFEKEDEIAASDLERYLGGDGQVWVNAVGLGDGEALTKIGELFGLHRLTLEDVIHVGQRPKAEVFDDHLFIVARMLLRNALPAEQISMIVGRGFLLTFQESPGDCFDLVRERLQVGKGVIRRRESDYLAYALLDSIIDTYFEVIEMISDRLEALEAEILETPSKSTVAAIQSFKTDLREMRRISWPHRDMIELLLREETPFVQPSTRVYLRDCADHAARVLDQLESSREAANDLMGAYLSSLSNRTNDVMKFLTIVASIFIPLSFIAGIYGMNFDPAASPWNMPELGARWGYPAVLGLMALVGGGMLAYSWRQGWFK